MKKQLPNLPRVHDSVFVIAEIGVNHDGNILQAKKLIDAAATAQVDAVKFQAFKANQLACAGAPLANYQKVSGGSSTDQYQMLERLELSASALLELSQYAQQLGLEFLCTPFDNESVTNLIKFGVNRVKVSSGDINNLPLLREISKLKLPVILSTGMSLDSEIDDAIQVLEQGGVDREKITILQCNTEYPTPLEDVNLRVIGSLKQKLGVNVGYSDHTEGRLASVAAVALGARVIEKHLTLDQTAAGPDHKASMEPAEFGLLVQEIRAVEQMLGSAEKMPTRSERRNISIARKSIVALRPIRTGEVLTEENLTCKRPGLGLSPMQWDFVLGTTASRDFDTDEPIEVEKP